MNMQLQDLDNKQTLEILTSIEIHLDFQLKILR
jgi:hypothetical protein